MKISLEEARKRATQGELWRDDDGFIAAGREDDYTTFADLDCNDRDIDEREVNKALLIHRWNRFDEVVAALENLLEHSQTGCVKGIPREDDLVLDSVAAVLARLKPWRCRETPAQKNCRQSEKTPEARHSGSNRA